MRNQYCEQIFNDARHNFREHQKEGKEVSIVWLFVGNNKVNIHSHYYKRLQIFALKDYCTEALNHEIMTNEEQEECLKRWVDL